MASLVQNGQIFVFSSGEKIAIYDLREKKFEVLDTVKISPEHEVPEEPSKGTTPTEGTFAIQAMAFSPSGEYFASCNDKKQLMLWKVGDTWKKISTRTMQRRSTAIVFPQTNDAVVVADRSGDVYSFSVTNPIEDGKLLMGHLSLLLDIVLTPNDEFVLTSDRDEKIRVSHYPNSYNIQTYCLGHSEFVSQIVLVGEDRLVSGSGDGTLRLWDYRDGREFYSSDCTEILEPGGGDSEEDKSENNLGVHCCRFHKQSNTLAVSFKGVKEEIKDILFYDVHSSSQSPMLSYKDRVSLDEPPWDLQFDSTGNLWVLQPKPEEPVIVFTHSANGKYQKLLPDNSLSEDVSKLCMQWEFFEASLKADSIFTFLYKSRVDNMKDYFSRKEQRMNKDKPSVSSEPPKKAAKLS